MEDQELQKQPIFKDETLKFHEYFPTAKLLPIGTEELPKKARIFFEKRHKNIILPNPNNQFKILFEAKHDSGDISYVAGKEVTYSNNNEKEDLLFIYEINASNKNTGYGEIRFNKSTDREYFKNKPFVGFTNTKSGFENKGLGTRRLHLMNALTKTFYNLPINSDTMIGDEAKGIWQKLVSKGEARKYKENSNDRFVFI